MSVLQRLTNVPSNSTVDASRNVAVNAYEFRRTLKELTEMAGDRKILGLQMEVSYLADAPTMLLSMEVEDD